MKFLAPICFIHYVIIIGILLPSSSNVVIVMVESAEDVNDNILTNSDCSSCSDVSTDVIQCYNDNDCISRECYDDASTIDEIKGCCSQCSNELEAAIVCFSNCLPSCIYETVVQYSGCLALMQCETDCKNAIDEAAEDIENEAVSIAEDVGVDVSSIDTSSSIEFDVTDLEEAIDEIETGGDLDDLTCSDLEGEYKDNVCDLANCCPFCINRFEDVAECIINEVVFQLILNDDTEEVCDVECGDIPQQEDDPMFDGWPPNRRHRQLERPRFLQPNPGDGGLPGDGGPPGDIPPGEGPPVVPGGNLPEDFGIFEECQMIMAAYMAVGEAKGAYDAYMSCLMGSLTKFSDETPTPSPTTEETSDGFYHQNGNATKWSTTMLLILLLTV